MQIDKRTQQRLTCAHRCLGQNGCYSSHVDTLQIKSYIKFVAQRNENYHKPKIGVECLVRIRIRLTKSVMKEVLI